MDLSADKRKATPQTSAFDDDRRVRQRLGPSASPLEVAPLAKANRQLYGCEDDPYNPENVVPLGKASHMKLCKAYIMSNAPSDPLVRIAIQDYLNTRFDSKDIVSDLIPENMRHAGVPDKQMAEVKELVNDEVPHKLSWALAERLDTSAKLDAALKQITEAAAFLHGPDIFDDKREPAQKAARGLSSYAHRPKLGGPEPHVEAPEPLLPVPALSQPRKNARGTTHTAALLGPQVEEGNYRVAATKKDQEPHPGPGNNRQNPIVKNSLRSRMKLFMGKKTGADIYSLTRDEAKLVFRDPMHLFAWRNLERAKLAVGQPRRPAELERELKQWYQEEFQEARRQWEDFWEDLVHNKKDVWQLVRKPQPKCEQTPSSHELQSIKTDDTTSNIHNEGPGVSRLFERPILTTSNSSNNANSFLTGSANGFVSGDVDNSMASNTSSSTVGRTSNSYPDDVSDAALKAESDEEYVLPGLYAFRMRQDSV